MQPDTQTTRHLVQAAEQLLPTLKARSLEIDQLRQVPQDLAETLAAQGFYRICTPAALGGLDAGPLRLGEHARRF